jgi:pimeloyl-ACP methyl ester carboxylesterase
LLIIDGLSIAVCSVGDPASIPVVVLHGWGANMQTVAPILDRLAPLGYRVHALDLPGFGESAMPPTDWGVAEYGSFVTHTLDALNLTRVHLIGHSFGGRLSVVLGADYPDRVNKIVITGGAGVLTPPSRKHRIIRGVRRLFTLPGLKVFYPRFQRWYWDRYASEDYKNAGALAGTFTRVVREDLLPRAARIKASTLLIWGDRDMDTPLWQAQKYEATIPDAGLVVFKGAGHYAYLERTADFVRIVDTFFKGA